MIWDLEKNGGRRVLSQFISGSTEKIEFLKVTQVTGKYI